MSDGVLRERLAVLGSPIAHSKSPAIHAAAYEVLGLDWAYGRQELQARDLEGFLDSLGPEWRGLSLTMPLKEEAHRLAAILDPVAQRSGAVNTLLRLSAGAGWAGFNTDVGGLAAAMHGAGLDALRTVVLGAGATAGSAVLAALGIGAERVLVLARRPEAAADLGRRFGSDTGEGEPLEIDSAGLADVDLAARLEEFAPTLVISTLPGPAGAEVALQAILTAAPLFDVAYDPWPSPLAERWREAGSEAHPGIDMLVEQALLQVRIFVGGDPSQPLADEPGVLAAMRSAARQ